jgi:lactoylglutathione lyase
MPIVTWDHVHLRSPDPEATAAWLEDILGGEIIRGPGRIDVKLGGAKVFIAPVTAGDGVNTPPVTPYQGLDHFGLTVKDIDTVAAEIKAKGVEFTKEPTTIRPGGAYLLHPRATGHFGRAARARQEICVSRRQDDGSSVIPAFRGSILRRRASLSSERHKGLPGMFPSGAILAVNLMR